MKAENTDQRTHGKTSHKKIPNFLRFRLCERTLHCYLSIGERDFVLDLPRSSMLTHDPQPETIMQIYMHTKFDDTWNIRTKVHPSKNHCQSTEQCCLRYISSSTSTSSSPCATSSHINLLIDMLLMTSWKRASDTKVAHVDSWSQAWSMLGCFCFSHL